MLPHYLAEVKVRVLAYMEKYADENVRNIGPTLIFEHTPNFNAVDLFTYLLIQFLVPVKYSL